MPGRKFTAGTQYRYGFNGKENDNEVKGEGNQQDYGMRVYDPRLGKFLSVDPLAKSFPWYTPFQFAGNTPIQAIDLDGEEPKSVVIQSISFSTLSISPEKDDPGQETRQVKVKNVTYKFTDAASHLLSLVSGIQESDIKKSIIKNAIGTLMPAYPAKEGGGAMTFPSGDDFQINYTDNFFSNENSQTNYGRTDYGDDVMSWLDLSSHEVGHIKDIKEIGGGVVKYFATFIKGYAISGSHDGNWREKRADVGQDQFRSFVSFVESYFGKDKMKDLFENKNNSQKDIIGRIDQWWQQYLKQKKESVQSTPSKKD